MWGRGAGSDDGATGIRTDVIILTWLVRNPALLRVRLVARPSAASILNPLLFRAVGDEQPPVHSGEPGHARAAVSEREVHPAGGPLLPAHLQYQLQSKQRSFTRRPARGSGTAWLIIDFVLLRTRWTSWWGGTSTTHRNSLSLCRCRVRREKECVSLCFHLSRCVS